MVHFKRAMTVKSLEMDVMNGQFECPSEGLQLVSATHTWLTRTLSLPTINREAEKLVSPMRPKKGTEEAPD